MTCRSSKATINTFASETIDLQAGRSALSGAMWIGLLGWILGGPLGWIAGLGIGPGVGVVTAKVVDLGIADAFASLRSAFNDLAPDYGRDGDV